MYSDYIEKRYGNIIHENKKLQEQLLEERKLRKKEREQHKKVREELQNKNEIIQKYEKLMKEKGITFD